MVKGTGERAWIAGTSPAKPFLHISFPGRSRRRLSEMSARLEVTILLLEHDEADIFFFRRALASLNFPGNVRVVYSVAEARDYLHGRGKYSDREYFPLPDLIVSDLKVPGRTGMEFLEWLRG